MKNILWNCIPQCNTGCPEKNKPQFLLNSSGYKHARRKVGFIALSGVQKLFCMIFESWYISKSKWGIRFQNVWILDNLSVLKSDVPCCFIFISLPYVSQKWVWTFSMLSSLKWDMSQPSKMLIAWETMHKLWQYQISRL